MTRTPILSRNTTGPWQWYVMTSSLPGTEEQQDCLNPSLNPPASTWSRPLSTCCRPCLVDAVRKMRRWRWWMTFWMSNSYRAPTWRVYTSTRTGWMKGEKILFVFRYFILCATTLHLKTFWCFISQKIFNQYAVYLILGFKFRMIATCRGFILCFSFYHIQVIKILRI